MDNNVFRTKVEPQVTESKTSNKPVENKGEVQDIKIEVPFTEYENMNHHPYIVDHFKLGDSWRDKLGGFEKEVNLIEDYFKGEINKGQIKNEVEAVKEKLNKIYKLANIEKTERITMQIEKLSAYLDFLRKTDQIDLNHEKYNH